jgi:chlorophyllide a reductase subunit Y
MGPAGAGSLGAVVNAALGNKARFETMKAFFEGVGAGDTAGVWEGVPKARPEFREQYVKRLEKLARARKSEALG